MALNSSDLVSIRQVFNDAFTDLMLPWFERIEARLDGHDQQFASVDQHFLEIDQRFDTIDRRFLGLEHEMRTGFAAVNGRLANLEGNYQSVMADIVELYGG